MKKLLVVSVLCILFVFAITPAFAGQGHRNTGCGLGTLLWENRADNSAVLQSLQATTNGSFGNQTFGITSGTSKCERAAKFVKNDRLNEFVVVNMDTLAKEIAMGRGETLETFAELMGIPAEKRPEFYQKLQANFATIFPSENVVLAKVVDNAATVSAVK